MPTSTTVGSASPPFPNTVNAVITCLHLSLQLIEVLEAEGKNLKGVRQEFIDKTLVGLAAWITASNRGLISWGMVVLQKPVGKRDGVCCRVNCLGGGRSVLRARGHSFMGKFTTKQQINTGGVLGGWLFLEGRTRRA